MDIHMLNNNNGHTRDWTDIQHVYDLIANEDGGTVLETFDPIPEFNEDLIDVFASSFGLPQSPLLSQSDLFETASTCDLDLVDSGSSQLKQLLLNKPNVSQDFRTELHYGSYQDDPVFFDEVSSTCPEIQVSTVTQSIEHTRETRTISRGSSVSYDSEEKSKTESKSNQKTLKFPPCFICGGKASGLHYGVNSCEACKGFFRRYLIRNEEYKCPKGGNCQIVNRNRENCSGCRLKKCFELGMSKEKSKLGRYTLSRRTETIRKVKALEKKEIKAKQQTELYACDRDHNYSENIRMIEPTRNGNRPRTEEFTDKLTSDLVQAMDDIKPYGAKITTKDEIENALKHHYDRYRTKVEMYGEMKSVPKEEYYKLLKEYGIDIDGRLNALKLYVREIERVTERYCNFAKMIPGFKQLPRKDQSTLLKADRCDFFLILMNEAYSQKFKTILSRNGFAYHVDEIADKHFSRDLINKVCDTYLHWQKLRLRKEEKALIIAITLFFTDRCNVEDIQQVESIQLRLVALLRSYLEKIYKSRALKRFAKIIDCLTYMRDSSEMYISEYKQLCNDETIIEAVPIMTEFLLEDW